MTKHQIRPNLLMGQRFLRSPAVLKKIIAAANLSGQEIILEIGPGTGVLTVALAKKAKEVIAVEKDRRLAAALEQKLKKEKISNVRLITGDILQIPNPYTLTPSPYKIVANIPYYLTGRLIRKFLVAERPPIEMLLMVQKEVADRIVSRSPKMNLLAIAVQAYAEPKILFEVQKSAFWPQPKVDSALIRISKISKHFFTAANSVEESKFFAVVRAAFQGKRKTLENSLSKNLKLSKTSVSKALSKLGLLGKRPEMLLLEDWAKIARALA